MSVFLMLLMILSAWNPVDNPSGTEPSAYSCMNAPVVWVQVAWLAVTCARVVAVLMFSVERRAALQAEAREQAELNAQITASEIAAAFDHLDNNNDNNNNNNADMDANVRRRWVVAEQLLGLSPAELATIPSFKLSTNATTVTHHSSTRGGPPSPDYKVQSGPALTGKELGGPALTGKGLGWPALTGEELGRPALTGKGLGWPALSGEELGECCAICLDTFVAGQRVKRLVRCTHSFHEQCIDKWLAVRNQCPYCRAFAILRPTNF